MTITTEFIDVAVADGTTMRAYLARPPGDPAPVGVIVVHELFGVNPDIQSVVDDLTHAGHVALAPEFYHRDTDPRRRRANRRFRPAAQHEPAERLG